MSRRILELQAENTYTPSHPRQQRPTSAPCPPALYLRGQESPSRLSSPHGEEHSSPSPSGHAQPAISSPAPPGFSHAPSGPAQSHTPQRHPGELSPIAATFTPSPLINSQSDSAAHAQTLVDEAIVNEALEKGRRASRHAEIMAMEDPRDQEDALNDWFNNQARPVSDEQLAREKEEKELEERRRLFDRK
ncbi:hypothetical protein F53441_4717 [Fusarium austroafricanum]|uniref:Uncharacterized protein n=1 Tax=Fusarium austroafricanum TaxID=2364996 RepID=A0A8H4KJP8_9HYPO|nr:hypothetical protein F53441_4717 [Fusarium austroafricanum]